LEEDIKILKEDDESKFLTLNQRNCVLFRQGEKEILIFLIEVAD
jgi:beta-galactosidase beta subunit